MTNKEAKGICEQSLNVWEQDNIEILTSKEMGAWLARRDENREKSGKWICVRWMQYKCSECDYDDIGTVTNYCPNCGARMESDV